MKDLKEKTISAQWGRRPTLGITPTANAFYRLRNRHCFVDSLHRDRHKHGHDFGIYGRAYQVIRIPTDNLR
jgi:hypothetical protein